MNTTNNLAPSPEPHRDMRDAVAAVLAAGATQVSVAREIGLSAGALSQWIKGTYKGDNEAVADKVSRWLANRQEATTKALPGAPRLANTPTGEGIRQRLFYAQEMASIVLIYGGAGVGKTTAVRRYRESNPNVWVVTPRPSGASLASTLEDIAAALELRGLPNRPSHVSAEIVRRVSGTRGLLVIDEAQHLSVPALEELRSIHDASGVGMALVGNDSVYSRLTGGSRQAQFAQLFSRVSSRLHLAGPQDGDADALLDAWNITGAAERDFARRVASLPGGLRGLSHAIRQAAIAAADAGQPINLASLRAAWNELTGD